MTEQTLCPICDEIFPEFLYCDGCQVGVKRVECRQNLRQARATFDSVWVGRHNRELSTALAARSITEYIKKLDGIWDILDVGCGSGLLVDMLFGKGYNSTGLDFSAETIKFAQSYKRGKYLCATVDAVGNKYDLVVMSHILEHIDNPVEYLRKVMPLIKPSGMLLVVVPNLDGYDANSVWRRESYITLFDYTHITALSRNGLVLLLEKVGYRILEVKTETLGVSLLNRVAAGLYRRMRGNPTIYKKQEPASMATPDRLHRIYKAIVETRLIRFFCYVSNRLSEHGGRGIDLVVLATPKRG